MIIAVSYPKLSCENLYVPHSGLLEPLPQLVVLLLQVPILNRYFVRARGFRLHLRDRNRSVSRAREPSMTSVKIGKHLRRSTTPAIFFSDCLTNCSACPSREVIAILKCNKGEVLSDQKEKACRALDFSPNRSKRIRRRSATQMKQSALCRR